MLPPLQAGSPMTRSEVTLVQPWSWELASLKSSSGEGKEQSADVKRTETERVQPVTRYTSATVRVVTCCFAHARGCRGRVICV